MRHLYLEVTGRCDLLCSHCAVRGRTHSHAHPTFDQLAVAMRGFRESGGEYVTFSGGEPGLRLDLSALIDEASGLGFKITVFTNGRAVTMPVLNALRRATGMLAVSVDGPVEAVHDALRGPGSFIRAVEALRLAVRELGGEKVILSCLLSTPLLPEISRMWGFVNQEGVAVLYVNIFEPIRQGYEHPFSPDAEAMVAPVTMLLNLAERQSKVRLAFSESNDLLTGKALFSRRTPEVSLGQTIKLQADGEAFPGPFYYASRFRLGRPFSETWASTLASPVLDSLRNQVVQRVTRTMDCSQCIWRGCCAGGSLALTWAKYGTFDHSCPLCGLYRAALDRAASKVIDREFAATA